MFGSCLRRFWKLQGRNFADRAAGRSPLERGGAGRLKRWNFSKGTWERVMKSLNKCLWKCKHATPQTSSPLQSTQKQLVDRKATKLISPACPHLVAGCVVGVSLQHKIQVMNHHEKSVTMLAAPAKDLVSWSNFRTEGYYFLLPFLFLVILTWKQQLKFSHMSAFSEAREFLVGTIFLLFPRLSGT